ncbi:MULTISPECIES: prepilin-type N-terminal cleavage/methylation domain-containing protein [unclassified Francisella]|uniref:prepilin-type N-terminal cleavage/methylation domain-containing protein n=1 Tax=unclassified Francisella TaxID=2610885 RepID=UPI002E319EA8|nr:MULTISPECIES: prepilin-type N-terminal cleavage/methylation domain-containing protein [unclassified Francisella]MED7818692.1 prepilin-type N-terminal cleavage/methylation domain-containing protein [Francisella sp. 19S2-4]MED7829591.1 prepilin-type N-terminal cleavage/methylation domain-containing protein [Francisella sp. 19S2-10]
MKTKQKNIKGFSLVELMVVIAIIAILAAIAIPIYSNHRERVEMIEAIGVIAGIEANISNDLNNNKNISNQSYDTPLGISVINGTISGATIEINMNTRNSTIFPNANDTLRLVGVVSGSTIAWSCSHNENASDITTHNVPNKCRNTFTA